jgi:hypothetical protein
MKQRVTIVVEDALAEAILTEAVKNQQLELACDVVRASDLDKSSSVDLLVWVGVPGSGISFPLPEAQKFFSPVRIGAVLDRVKAMQKFSSRRGEVAIGPFKLEEETHRLLDTRDQSTIRLTEKESHILQILAAAQGGIVGKDEMLARVWNYADGVETHTLETHIYRLRRKIEKDPAKPDILLTEEPGYKIKT